MRRQATSCVTAVMAITAAFADPMTGTWTLNLQRSHYGGGAEVRRQETLSCQLDGELLKCTIESVRADGRKLVGTFAASYDGKRHAAAGIPDVDEVAMQKVDDFIADATFSYQGKPVFGYRAIRSDNGQSLTIVAVEPTTRVVGSSVVVYDRR